jgi:hypothetical protein
MDRSKSRRTVVAAVVLMALAGAACASSETDSMTDAKATSASSDLPQGGEVVELDPDDFTTDIDNPWWPMAVGSQWVYTETDSEGANQRVEVTVTDKTKTLANGIEVRVVHDAVTEDGEPVEITDDYYAQDSKGNIWYMGEDTAEYEDGKVSSREGSWEAGKHGAQAGVALPADPKPGMTYRQEYWKGHAEDNGEVIKTDVQTEVPFGHFTRVLMTMDTNPLEPKNLEFKFYAKDVGPALEINVSGGSDRAELITYEKGS